MMKRFFALLLSCWVLCLSVSAVYEVNDDTSIQTPAPVSPSVDSVVDVPPPTFTLDEVFAALPESVGSPDVVSDDVVLTGVSRVSVPPIIPLREKIGNYDLCY